MQSRPRPRYARITALVLSVAVTVLALLSGAGVLGSDPAAAGGSGSSDQTLVADISAPLPAPAGRVASESSKHAAAADLLVPADSGTGERVVFDLSAQRVWLVGADDSVRRSYLVSGSLTDNLDPGSYAVYSRSRHAVGVEDSGTMGYFVRFTHGDHAAIGFHDIPVDHGVPLQTADQLGAPQSHGCIRQQRRDAVALWKFAPVGTRVVVVA
ncbi:MAG: L,D-transpeptidase [Marmoricola sp.]